MTYSGRATQVDSTTPVLPQIDTGETNDISDEVLTGKPSRSNWWIALAMLTIAVSLGVHHLVAALGGQFHAMAFRSFDLALVMTAGFLYFPLGRTSWQEPVNKWFLVDLTLILLTLASGWHILHDPFALLHREASPTHLDLVLSLITVLLIAELCRRTIGWAVVAVMGFFVLHALFGNYFPGVFNTPPLSFKTVMTNLYIRGSSGIFGLPLGVVSSYVYLFLLFASLLLVSGAARFFIELAFALTGRMTGGPAKAAVIASAGMGTLSGSAAANVVTTGSLTIPLMRQLGYDRTFAGAVEAVASSGGQIMPPIMGATAFIIAEFLGVPYVEVVKAATLPAILYFGSLFAMVHFRAVKLGLRPVSSEGIPRLWAVVWRGGHFTLAIVVIVLVLARGMTPQKAALYGLLAIFLLSFMRRENWIRPVQLLGVFEQSLKAAIPLIAAVAAAGVIIGSIEVSGLGLRLSSMIIKFSAGSLPLALVMTMIACLILGMGMPTAAVYVTVAALIIPTLVELGVQPMAAHMFAFYFGVIGLITPPVAIAAFTASALAGSKPMSTALVACTIGIAAYIVPFMFVYNPVLLWQGSGSHLVQATVTAIVGVTCLAAAVEGWVLRRAGPLARILFGVAAISLIQPGTFTDLIGLACAALAMLIQLFGRRRDLAAAQTGSLKGSVARCFPPSE